MAVSEEQVRLALEQVIDPELFVNIVDLGLIYKVEITEAGAAPHSADPAADPAWPASIAPEHAGADPSSAPSSVPPSAPSSAPSAALTTAPPSGAEAVSAAPAAIDGSTPAATGGVDVLIEMTMTSPACPAGPELLGRSKMVTSALEGVRNVDVKLVMTPPWSPDRMTEAARDQLGIF